MQKFILTTAAAICLTACGSPSFNAQQIVDRLQPGVSTLSDATRLLGEPAATSKLDNDTLVQWIDIRGWPFRAHGAHLAILFDGTDKMVRVTHKYDN